MGVFAKWITRTPLFLTLSILGCGGAGPVTVTPPPPKSGISAHYQLTILPPVAGGTATEAEAVNDFGEVAGYSVINGQGEATTWDSAGNATDLGPGYALGINNSNLIVGYALDANQHPHAVSWKALPNQIGLEIESAFSAFGVTYDASEALGVDDDGSIVGFVFSMTDPNAQSSGWKLTPNSEVQGVYAMAETLAVRQGLVAGYDNTFNPVLGDATYENVLGTFTGVSKDARACGSDFNGGGFVVQGVALKIGIGANLYGINSQGVAVGSDLEGAPVGSLRLATKSNRKRLQTLDPHDLPLTNKAIAWTEDLGEIGLTNRIDSAGWRLVWATAINESGDIVGVAVDDQNQLVEGFLLKPQ